MDLASGLETAVNERAPQWSEWVKGAVARINADFNRSADTHLIKVDLPKFPGISLYLKDESIHPSGSLKHRLARSLFLYGLCNGLIGPETPIIECSSGSTAISEAYFARLLGLRFIAVVPDRVAPSKLDQIAFFGGEAHKVAPSKIYDAAEALSRELGGHYMNQFMFAERATDWRGNNNIADSLFTQMKREISPIPSWIVMSAGTGGTSATLGRYIRYHEELTATTRLCVVDPEHSVFFDGYRRGDRSITLDASSRIEGIGRPRIEPSFLPDVIDRMLKIPDAASVATVHWLETVLGRKCGGSTGTNVYGALALMNEMREQGEDGSIATLICDSGERYLDTYFDTGWIERQGLELGPYLERLLRLTGV